MDKLQAEKLCRVLVEKCIGIRPGEVSLIVTSPAQSAQVSKELFRSLTARGSRAMMLFVPEVLLTEDRLPSAVTTSMKQAHVSILYTQRMFPVSARESALSAGSRILSLSGVASSSLAGAADVDYDQLSETVLNAVNSVEQDRCIRITSPVGTDVAIELEQAPIRAFTGTARHAGEWTEIPGGSFNAIARPGSAEGTLVIDGSVTGPGIVSESITLTLAEGRITAVQGGKEAAVFRSLIDKGDDTALLLTEVGAGFNPQLNLTGEMREDQRAANIVQIGFGRNSHLGGTIHSSNHIDVCLSKCKMIAGTTVVLPD